METYYKLINLMIQCESDLKDKKTIKEFAPSCSINELAFYLYKHGVKIESEVKNECS